MTQKKQSPEAAVLQCPLCEGRGELPEKEMLDRLREKDLCRKIASYLENVVEAEEKVTSPEPAYRAESVNPTFRSNVDTWNLTHFLWRRSPKE